MRSYPGQEVDLAELGAAQPATYAYDPEEPQGPATFQRGGWPARSAWGETFRREVAPVPGTGRGLVNAPSPIVLGYRPEMNFIGNTEMANIAPQPIMYDAAYGGPLPIAAMPELDIPQPYDGTDPTYDYALGAALGR